MAKASALLDRINKELPKLTEEGRRRALLDAISTWASIVGLVIFAVICWIYAPKLAWRLWIKTHKDWVVRG